MLLFPFLTATLTLILCAWFLVVAGYIWSTGGIELSQIKASRASAGASMQAHASSLTAKLAVHLGNETVAAAQAAAAAALAAKTGSLKAALSSASSASNVTAGGGGEAAAAAGGMMAAAEKLSPEQWMKGMLAYHFFVFLWTNNLVQVRRLTFRIRMLDACVLGCVLISLVSGFWCGRPPSSVLRAQAVGMCTIAGVVSRFYWSKTKSAKEMGRLPLVSALLASCWYHVGSLCFGALILAVLQFVRAVLAYIDSKTKSLQDGNKMLKMLMKCVQCCLWCFEKVPWLPPCFLPASVPLILLPRYYFN
jgi:hypothetical protein